MPSLAPKSSLFASFAVAVVALSAAPAGAQTAQPDLKVKFDQSQLIKLPRPASSIIIGNPAVAEFSIQDANMLVVTGKSYGITNVIILDAERNVIQDQRVTVVRDEVSMVHVYKAANRSSYNCSPQCNASIIPGDDPRHFSSARADATAKIGFNERYANSESGSEPQQ